MTTEPIAHRLALVQQGLVDACLAAGRNPSQVKLVAVSKTYPAGAVQEAYEAGQLVFGENKVQELVSKQLALAATASVQWHLIGHLQTNKVKYVASFVALIHSLDSLKLLEEIERQAARLGRVQDCLIQLNISDESTKNGTNTAGAHALLQALPRCPHVRVLGLMGMAAPLSAGITARDVQAQFAGLRQLCQQLRITYGSAQAPLQELSMGMSADYALAIAEGATLVRIGSALFGARN